MPFLAFLSQCSEKFFVWLSSIHLTIFGSSLPAKHKPNVDTILSMISPWKISPTQKPFGQVWAIIRNLRYLDEPAVNIARLIIFWVTIYR